MKYPELYLDLMSNLDLPNDIIDKYKTNEEEDNDKLNEEDNDKLPF
jgi:hypothetical protein